MNSALLASYREFLSVQIKDIKLSHFFMEISQEAQYEQKALFHAFWSKNKKTLDAFLAGKGPSAESEELVVVSVGSSSTQFYNFSNTITGGVFAGTEAMQSNVELVDTIFAKIKECPGAQGKSLMLLFCNSIAFSINSLPASLDLCGGDVNFDPIVKKFAENVVANNYKGYILHRNEAKMKNDWVQCKAQEDFKDLGEGKLFFVAEFGGGGIVMNYYDEQSRELKEYNKDRFLLGKQAEFVKDMQNVDESHHQIQHIRGYITAQIEEYIKNNSIVTEGKEIVCHIYQTGQLREFYCS